MPPSASPPAPWDVDAEHASDAVGYDAEVGPTYAGDATLELFDSPTEELTRLAPFEIIGGYYRQVGQSMHAGTTVAAQPNPMAE